MISIGKPEIGKELIAHLGLENGEEYLFVGKEATYVLSSAPRRLPELTHSHFLFNDFRSREYTI